MSAKRPGRSAGGRGVLSNAVGSLRSVFWSVAVISCALNLLMLTGPIFMLQVYERVLASRSIPTLVALSVLAGALYLFWGLFEFLRSRTLSRASFWLDQRLGPPAFKTWLGRSFKGSSDDTRPMVDIAAIRQFPSSPALTGLFDLPWIPIYLGFIFIVHPWLGWLTIGGAAFVTVLALAIERNGRGHGLVVLSRDRLGHACQIEPPEGVALDSGNARGGVCAHGRTNDGEFPHEAIHRQSKPCHARVDAAAPRS